MTDNEIIKTLKLLLELVIVEDCSQRAKIISNTLDLINRQKAEIERLKAKCENTQVGYNFAKDESNQWKEEANRYQNLWCKVETDIQTAKAEAYKEFAERLKSKYAQTSLGGMDKREIILYLTETQLMDELKEMVGEDK